jgi:propanediol dehydratase small subunit
MTTPSPSGPKVTSYSGTDLSDITVEAAIGGRLSADDVRIHPDTLRAQAMVAEQGSNPQFGANLRRAAELATLPDDELLRMYDLMRPGRATEQQLVDLRDQLAEAEATSCAALVSEALAAYRRRGLLRR